VFFYILNLTLQRSLIDGYLAILAAVLVDYLYITLAVLGVGKLLEKGKHKSLLGLSSSIVLVIFGVLMVLSGAGSLPADSLHRVNSYFSSFLSTLLLTISSPLTIIFWTSLFASKAVEKGYSKKELIPFGFAAGLATVVFLGLMVTGMSSLKVVIPSPVIQILNLGVGVVLIFYGLVRLGKQLREKTKNI
jgi:threonine/homoserine/homoserine lactone efflux protein